MNLFSILLILFWIIIIANPAIIAYLIGWFMVFIWANILIFSRVFWKKKKWEENYVKFWNFKIYR